MTFLFPGQNTTTVRNGFAHNVVLIIIRELAVWAGTFESFHKQYRWKGIKLMVKTQVSSYSPEVDVWMSAKAGHGAL